MQFDVSVAMTWILFLALFPMAFIWLRRAWRVLIKKNFSEVALKHGQPPKNPKKWAPFVGTLNLIAGSMCVWVIGAVLLGLYPYDTWSAMAGVTIWAKIFADFIIKMQAHPIKIKFGRKEKPETENGD